MLLSELPWHTQTAANIRNVAHVFKHSDGRYTIVRGIYHGAHSPPTPSEARVNNYSACVACYAAQVALVAMLLGGAWWATSNDYHHSAAWLLIAALLCVVGWSCRYTIPADKK